MKRIILLCLAVILIIPNFSVAGVIGPARVRLVDGDIMFRTPDVDEWLPAAINTPLDEGDTLWCPDGAKVEIQLSDGTLVRLDGGSQLELIANEEGFTQLHLASGRLYVRTTKTSTLDSLQIDADDTTVLPAARTRLSLDMLPNNQEDVSIFKGSAYVEGNGNRTNVRAGEQIAMEEDHSELLPLKQPDSWENWNMERDRALSREARADSYLPDELQSYSSELDSNGSWVSDQEYGMVWRPSVVVSTDWAPYSSGRWIWKGDDYVWISFESWGWVPYHYGRWSFSSRYGWCWVPPARGDVYWGPGYVGWYRTGDHVGWTPLAPGEIFYGRRNYGRHSVNITNTRVITSTVKYRNQRARGGLTVLPQSDFLRGRAATRQPARNSSVSVSVSIGSPRLQPLRETRMPIVRKAPPRVAPPRIERKDPRELRQRFPRVTPAVDARPKSGKPAPVIKAPAAQPTQPPRIREKRTIHPVVVPTEKKPDAVTPPKAAPPQRDERRQRPTVAPPAPAPPAPPAQPVPPAALPAPQIKRPATETVPKVREQRQRPAATPAVPQVVVPPSSDVPPQRREQPRRATPQVTAPQKATEPQKVTPQRAEKPQKEPIQIQKELKQKKVWRVKTPEDAKESDPKEKELKDRDRKGR